MKLIKKKVCKKILKDKIIVLSYLVEWDSTAATKARSEHDISSL